ncbi:outer membrane protein porin [Artemisia annua]|uniref:Outer membrane protein porin n=1 Tax=Artemisia annua TaxID=35608 RepID=A0A2U1LAZ9_ARTAN|nr:outer membrane protein porin [Artemisia annua]
MLDIQKEFFTNQIESFKSESVNHENVNEILEQTSSLKSENLYLKKKITELSKEATDVKQELSKRTAQFEKDLAKLEAQGISFQLKLQEKNEKSFSEKSLTSVLKGKEKIFEEICDDTTIKFDFDELDTKNIELEHAVASLQKENEHLKIIPNHLFEKEKFVLQKKIVELEKMVAQQTKDFGDAKNDFSIETEKYEKYFAHLENQNASLHAKLASSDHLSLQKEYNDLRTSYNALKAKFDVLNRSKGKSHVSNESKPQVSFSEKVYTGESSKPFSKKVSQFTTYSLQKGRKFSKRPNFSETFTYPKLVPPDCEALEPQICSQLEHDHSWDQHALDPLAIVKARYNNLGKENAFIQHDWRPKSLFTISGEVDTNAIYKISNLGICLPLKP